MKERTTSSKTTISGFSRSFYEGVNKSEVRHSSGNVTQNKDINKQLDIKNIKMRIPGFSNFFP
jgi:TRAP-type mannitol/chloroaromatic compound transport system substrate-binding protein